MDDRIPTFEASQADTVSSLLFFLTLIKAAKCPWQSHFFFFFFAQVLVSPASFAARSGHMIQSWPKDQGGILLGVIP